MNDPLSSQGVSLVDERIGEGGSAYVHKGKVVPGRPDAFPVEGTLLAVKEYKPSILEIPNQLERIRQEARIGRKIDHPNVVKVYGAHLPEDGKGKCYLFMEWVEGETLDKWAAQLRKNASWERLKMVCEDIVNGVSELHSRSILHRDIKPENVMVTHDSAKLMDIGVAEITDDNPYTLHTAVKDFVGSVRYASPQFIMGEDFDAKDDIYSIGATFLELLTGKCPYEEVVRKPVLPIIVTQHPPEVGSLRDNVPSAMKMLIEGCLHPTRDRRPTLDEILDCLQVGDQAQYIQRETRGQATEQRGYKVLRVDPSKGGFYADLRSDTPISFGKYNVVRKDHPLEVPSLNDDVEPERWIATAELKHQSQRLGYFKLIGKRWDEGHKLLQVGGLHPAGWEEFDKMSESVQVGDYVVNKPGI